MVQRYEVRGTELGGDAFYEDWVEVVRYEDYAKLKSEMQKDIDALQREVEHKTKALDYLYNNQASSEKSVCRKNDTQECAHEWSRYLVHPYRKICLVCGVKE